MNGFASNGESGADGSAKKGWRTLTRVASALTRRGKREAESAEPVSAILDLSTLEAGGAAAFFWTNAIFAFLSEPSWTWGRLNEDNSPSSLFWGALGLLLTAIALLLLTTRAIWTVALLGRKKGVQATLLFWAGLTVFAVALLEGAGLILAVWER